MVLLVLDGFLDRIDQAIDGLRRMTSVGVILRSEGTLTLVTTNTTVMIVKQIKIREPNMIPRIISVLMCGPENGEKKS